jgi:hypothetical protein
MPYYVSIQGQTFGPAEAGDLKQWHRAGAFGPSDFIWDDAANTWIEAAKIPELEAIFRLPPSPTTGVEDIEELPRPEVARAAIEATAEPEATAYCANHEMDASTGICPRCQRALCDRCFVTVDGLKVCVDCVGEQKGSASAGWKRTATLVCALGSIPLIMLGAYIFFASTPAVQSELPEKIPVTLGEPPPPVATEFLTPAERQQAEEAMKAIFEAATAGAGAATGETDASGGGGAQPPSAAPAPANMAAPPREGLEFRVGEDGRSVELRTTGEDGRAFLIYDSAGLKDVPKE